MSSLQLVENTPLPVTTGLDVAEIQAMQRAVIHLFQRWGLTDEQACILLGEIAKRTFQRWKKGELGRVGVDLATRLSNLMGIHKALRLLFNEPQRGYDWIKHPNETFHDQSALDVMLAGQLTDLMRVRHYLGASRGS
jgi:uncharacterized protein (DUF2384 family)